MNRVLVVVFDNEAKAYEGSDALQELEVDSIIAVRAARIVTKAPDGTTVAVTIRKPLPEGTMGATAAGSVIGMFGGPAGLVVGAASGFVLGATTDLARTRVAADFVTDVEQALAPGKAAVVAEIDEGPAEPVDTAMKALGGSVLRRAPSKVGRKRLPDSRLRSQPEE
jgi:uncharacterized membrane protein